MSSPISPIFNPDADPSTDSKSVPKHGSLGWRKVKEEYDESQGSSPVSQSLLNTRKILNSSFYADKLKKLSTEEATGNNSLNSPLSPDNKKQ